MFLTGRAAAIVAATLVFGACATPQARYVDEVAAITATMSEAVFEALPRGVVPTRAGVTGVVAARQAAAQALDALTPPEEMRAEHLVFVLMLERFVTASQGFLDETRDLDADAFRDALSASTHLDPIAAAVGTACVAWERRAAAIGHATVLSCSVTGGW